MGLVVWLFGVYACYIILLIPYVVVGGDASYVQLSELFSVSKWRHNAIRKADVLHLGPMHPNGGNKFIVALVEAAAKICLPATQVLDKDPHLQMMIVTTIGSVLCLVTWLFRPSSRRASCPSSSTAGSSPPAAWPVGSWRLIGKATSTWSPSSSRSPSSSSCHVWPSESSTSPGRSTAM